MGKVVVHWTDNQKVKYKNAVINVEKRIVAVYQRDKTLIIPFENIAVIEKEEGEDDELPSEFFY